MSGVPRSFCIIGWYSTGSKLQSHVSFITEEIKVTKTRQVVILRDSADEKVRQVEVDIKTGRNWVSAKAVEIAESRLRQRHIIEVVTTGWPGNLQRLTWRAAGTKDTYIHVLLV